MLFYFRSDNSISSHDYHYVLRFHRQNTTSWNILSAKLTNILTLWCKQTFIFNGIKNRPIMACKLHFLSKQTKRCTYFCTDKHNCTALHAIMISHPSYTKTHRHHPAWTHPLQSRSRWLVRRLTPAPSGSSRRRSRPLGTMAGREEGWSPRPSPDSSTLSPLSATPLWYSHPVSGKVKLLHRKLHTTLLLFLSMPFCSQAYFLIAFSSYMSLLTH